MIMKDSRTLRMTTRQRDYLRQLDQREISVSWCMTSTAANLAEPRERHPSGRRPAKMAEQGAIERPNHRAGTPDGTGNP